MGEGNLIDNLSRNEKKRRTILRQVNRLAWLLDNSVRIPIINYRIGLNPIIGLIPGFGDFAGLLISSVIVVQALRLGVPKVTLMRMLLNITLEATIGMIPILGDLFDATYKANLRNVALLKQAIDDSQTGRPLGKAADTRAVVMVIGTLVGLIVLIGGLGIALFWWVASIFLRD